MAYKFQCEDCEEVGVVEDFVTTNPHLCEGREAGPFSVMPRILILEVV